MIVVTGANGKLGQHVLEGLIEKMPKSEIIAAVRNSDAVQSLQSFGIQVRHADYSKPETLGPAFRGADKVLLISSSAVGHRVPQHAAVVDAAKTACVRLIAYTSILRADTSSLLLAPEHKATEEYIRASGLPFVFLRNGWYLENQTEALGPALQHGVILGAARDGRFASATRADYAAAAVKVLCGSGHENKVYELGGDTSYTLSEMAAEVFRQSGKSVAYQDLSEHAYVEALVGFGLPAGLAGALADADAGASRGELDCSTHHLSQLIGRPTTTLSQAISAALQSLKSVAEDAH